MILSDSKWRLIKDVNSCNQSSICINRRFNFPAVICLLCEVLLLKDKRLELIHKGCFLLPPQFYTTVISLHVDVSSQAQSQSFQAPMKASCAKISKLLEVWNSSHCRKANNQNSYVPLKCVYFLFWVIISYVFNFQH